MYFNNVETKPGIGYPKKWEDQDHYKGGWDLKNGELSLKSGSKAGRMLKLFIIHSSQPCKIILNLGFYYRDTISPWFRSLFMLQPEGTLLFDVPVLFKIHMVSWMLAAVIFPFTRLVHCLSLPLEYLWRRPIIYRKR